MCNLPETGGPGHLQTGVLLAARWAPCPPSPLAFLPEKSVSGWSTAESCVFRSGRNAVAPPASKARRCCSDSPTALLL